MSVTFLPQPLREIIDWLQRHRRLSSMSAFAAIGALLIVASTYYAYDVPTDFNQAYNFQITEAIAKSFCYCTRYHPTVVFPSASSTNGILYYVGAAFYAMTGSMDTSVLGVVAVGTALLVIALFCLAPWLILVAALLFVIWPTQDATFLSFLGELWALGFALLGIWLLRAVEVRSGWLALFRSNQFRLAVLCFGLSMESKLIAVAATGTIPLAIFYEKFALDTRSRPTLSAVLRTLGAGAACFAGSAICLFLVVSFSVAHSLRAPFAVGQMAQAVASFVGDMFVGHGAALVQAHDSLGGFASGISQIPIAVILLVVAAAVALLYENPGYVVFIVTTLGLCGTLLAIDPRYTVIPFDLIVYLGAMAAYKLRLRVSIIPAAFAVALAVTVLTRTPFYGTLLARGASTGLNLSTNAVDTAAGPYAHPYVYSQELVRDLRQHRYVLTSGWWQMPEISSRYGLTFYDRMAIENAGLWNQDSVLLFDRYNHDWPETSRAANCGFVIDVDGPLVLCRPRPDVPLDFLAPGAPSASSGRGVIVDLDHYSWSATRGIRAVSGASPGVVQYAYRGDGTADSDERVTLEMPVQAGKTYVFSALVDPSGIHETSGTNGQFDLFIDTPDARSTYAISYYPVGPPTRYATDAWTCPPGVTRVELGLQLTDTVVRKGGVVRFSLPRLTVVESQGSQHTARKV